MKGAIIFENTKMLFTRHGGEVMTRHQMLRRGMVGKAPNRAAVHGTKLPSPDIIPKREVEMEIEKAIVEKDKRRKEIEESVDSKLKNWQVLYVEQIVSAPTKMQWS